MAQRVVQEVGDQAIESSGIAHHLRGANPRGVEGDRRARASPKGRLQHDVVEVDRLGRRCDALGSGQVEEIVHEVLQARDLVEGAAVRGHEVSSLGMGQVDLELGPHPRQRTAELVGRVGDQASLLVRRPLEAIEHPVHGLRQARDLVAGLGHGDPMIEVVRADGGDLASDRLHRADRPPHEPPDDRPEQDRHEGDGRDERPLQRGGALSHVVEVDAEVQDRAVGQGLGAHPVGPLALHHAADVPHDVIIGRIRRGGDGVRQGAGSWPWRLGHHLAVAHELGDGVVVAGWERRGRGRARSVVGGRGLLELLVDGVHEEPLVHPHDGERPRRAGRSAPRSWRAR